MALPAFSHKTTFGKHYSLSFEAFGFLDFIVLTSWNISHLVIVEMDWGQNVSDFEEKRVKSVEQVNKNISMPVLGAYVLGWLGIYAAVFVLMTANTAPTAPELAWNDDTPDTTTDLKIAIAKESIASRQPTYEYEWTINDALVWKVDGTGLVLESDVSTEDKANEKALLYGGRSLTSDLITRGDSISVKVTPDDTTKGGTFCFFPWRECAGEVHVVEQTDVINSLPKARFSFVNDEPTSRDDLELSIRGLDADEDEVSFTYVWEQVGEEWEEGEELEPQFAEEALSSRYTRRGQEWKVTVTPHDGESDEEVCERLAEAAEEDADLADALEDTAAEELDAGKCHKGRSVSKTVYIN